MELFKVLVLLVVMPLGAVSVVVWKLVEAIRSLVIKQRPIEAGKEMVIVTGCDTGIGRELALRLAGEGAVVAAGCLTKEGEESIQKEFKSLEKQKGGEGKGSILPVSMDVTSDDSMNRARGSIEEFLAANKEVKVWGLVNNAGITRDFLFEFLKVSDFKMVTEVNYLGVVRSTHTFLPLVKKNDGRIVNLVSAAGLSVGPMQSCYCSSKWAAQAFSICLRVELALMYPKMRVSTINPAFIQTPMVAGLKDVVQRHWNNGPADVKELLGGEDWKELRQKEVDKLTSMADPPCKVTDAITDALFSSSPQRTYLVGNLAYFVYTVGWFIPAEYFCSVLGNPGPLPKNSK